MFCYIHLGIISVRSLFISVHFYVHAFIYTRRRLVKLIFEGVCCASFAILLDDTPMYVRNALKFLRRSRKLSAFVSEFLWRKLSNYTFLGPCLQGKV